MASELKLFSEEEDNDDNDNDNLAFLMLTLL